MTRLSSQSSSRGTRSTRSSWSSSRRRTPSRVGFNSPLEQGSSSSSTQKRSISDIDGSTPSPNKAKRNAWTSKQLVQRQTQDAAREDEGTIIGRLQKIWECDDFGCRNLHSMCFVLGNTHYWITQHQMKESWAKGILAGTATDKSPPPVLLQRLFILEQERRQENQALIERSREEERQEIERLREEKEERRFRAEEERIERFERIIDMQLNIMMMSTMNSMDSMLSSFGDRQQHYQ